MSLNQCISFILINKLKFVSAIIDMIHICYNNFCFMQYIILVFKVLIHNPNIVEYSMRLIIFNINVVDT